MKPSAILSPASDPQSASTLVTPGRVGQIRVEFAPLQGQRGALGNAHAAGAFSSAITPGPSGSS